MKKVLTIVGFIMIFAVNMVFGDVIISEMCDPGTAYQTNRFIEIYNTGDASVDLSGWSVDAIINDGNTVAETWNLSGSIASGEALVCGDNDNTLYTCDFPVDWTAYTSWNGKTGDGAKLYNGVTLIDNAGAHGNFENKTTQRNANIGTAVTTYNSLEWTSTATTNYENATPGTHVCDFPAGSSPLITLSEISLSGFSYIDGNGPSAEQSFTAQGINLTANISIVPPTNYEISTGSGGSFVATNPITLTQSGGSVGVTTIYVRLKAGLSIAAYNNEDITASSTDADNKTVTCSGSVTAELPNAWINEIHYDNDGGDVNEGVEVIIENPGDYTLSNFLITLYNLTGGASYDSETLNNFTVGNSAGIYTIYYNITSLAGMQNGPNDGIALSYNGSLIQFLSYEGTLTATDGPAIGITSTDIGVSENGTGLTTTSLQLTGSGTQYSDFSWSADVTQTWGSANDGGSQTLPVTLSTFTAQYLNSKPTLYWQTQSEEDNMGWFIYRNTVEDFTSAEKISGMLPGHGTTTQPQSYIYEDVEQLQVEQTYYYWLESVDYSGTLHHFDMVANVTIPHPNDPGQNITPPVAYEITADPNPFSYTTEITFAMSQTSLVDAAIYNLKGQLVKSYDTVMTNADEDVSFQWNGKDDSGKSLSNGVYLYSVKVNGKDYATKQLILMK